MLPSTRFVRSMRGLAHLGTWNDDHHKMLGGRPAFFCCFLDQGFPVSTDGQNPLVVHNDELSKMRGVLLNVWCTLSPIEVLSHSLFQLGHFTHLHGAASTRNCSETIPSYQKAAGEERLPCISNTGAKR